VATAGVENGGDHHGPTMELLRAGIPVLGEKPIANRLDQAREMVACARERGVPYGINLNHRFTPAAHRAREWLDAGRLGRLHLVNMTMWINNPNESSPHFHMRALHPHSIDVMRYFGGDVERVHAFFARGEGRTIWSNVQMSVLFRSGAIGQLTGSYDAGPGYGLETCELVGSDGRAVIREACEVLEFTPRRELMREEYRNLGGMRSFQETFPSRISAWLDDLERGTPPEQVDGAAEDALRAQEVIEAAIRSFELGRAVSPEEV
jgi:predicted dehydrogenase